MLPAWQNLQFNSTCLLYLPENSNTYIQSGICIRLCGLYGRSDEGKESLWKRGATLEDSTRKQGQSQKWEEKTKEKSNLLYLN